jgi:transcriptional regulator with XRE-family HTH domain
VVSMFDEAWTGRQLLITQRLRHRRVELGLTQKQVVSRLGRAGVHTTNRAVSSLEHGSGVDVAKLPEIARVLECTITYLVGLTDDPHSWQPDPAVVGALPNQAPHSHPDRAPHTHPHSGPHTHPTLASVPEPQSPDCRILGVTFPEDRRRRLN